MYFLLWTVLNFQHIVQKYLRCWSIGLSVCALISLNMLGLPQNLYILLRFTVVCSLLKIKYAAFIIHSQGQSKEFRYKLSDLSKEIQIEVLRSIIIWGILVLHYITKSLCIFKCIVICFLYKMVCQAFIFYLEGHTKELDWITVCRHKFFVYIYLYIFININRIFKTLNTAENRFHGIIDDIQWCIWIILCDLVKEHSIFSIFFSHAVHGCTKEHGYIVVY